MSLSMAKKKKSVPYFAHTNDGHFMYFIFYYLDVYFCLELWTFDEPSYNYR